MAWDADAKKLAIKAIATVESNLRYDAINYNDPITVGISQWYGTRAAHLLMQLRTTPAWVGVAATVTTSLDANPSTDADYWTSRYLTRSEGTSLKPVLTSDTGVQVQNAQTLADLEAYKTRADRAGLDADTNTNAFIFWCVMYHQSPRYSLNILNAAGTDPTLSRLYTMALNHFWYKNYRTRFTTAKNIIETGDSTGIPDFGVDETPDVEGGDNDDDDVVATGQSLGNIRHVRAVGDAIHVILSDGTTVICNPTGATSWLPMQTDGSPAVAPATPETSPNTPGGGTATENALVAFLLARVGQYAYSQGLGRNDPDASGVGDCSSVLRFAYRKVAGIEIGTYTVDQQRYGTAIWSNLPGNKFGNAKNSIPPLGILRAGDCVFFGWSSTFRRLNHVEMYLGDGRLIGHGGPGNGPTIKPSATSYMDTAPWIIVRRYL